MTLLAGTPKAAAPPILFFAALACVTPAQSGLQIAPIILELTPQQKSYSISVKGDSETRQKAQVRVLRWVQKDGVEVLEPTKSVVVSPPAFATDKTRPMTVRVVRVATEPVTTQECYRILVDEVAEAKPDQVVTFQIRQSLPLCYTPPGLKAAAVAWSIQNRPEGPVLVGVNSGQMKMAAGSVAIAGKGDAKATLGRAVVLGGSRMSWPLQGATGDFAPGSAFTIKYKVDAADVTQNGTVSAK